MKKETDKIAEALARPILERRKQIQAQEQEIMLRMAALASSVGLQIPKGLQPK